LLFEVSCAYGVSFGFEVISLARNRLNFGHVTHPARCAARMNGAEGPPLRSGIRLFPAALAALAGRRTSE